MIARAALACAVALGLGTPGPAAATASYGFQAFVGAPLSLRTPLIVRQRGEPELRFRARWSTRPFDAPIYYGLGLFRRDRGREWALELVHHKLHLEEPPPEVERFSISHGYNLVVLSHGAELIRGAWVRLGAGAVIAHPESTVRGRTLAQTGGPFGLGYHLAGPAVSAGLDGRLPLGDRYRIALGGRVTAAYADVPIADGRARVPNVAFHATAGVDGDVLR